MQPFGKRISEILGEGVAVPGVVALSLCFSRVGLSSYNFTSDATVGGHLVLHFRVSKETHST